jgi:hypothetical protein
MPAKCFLVLISWPWDGDSTRDRQKGAAGEQKTQNNRCWDYRLFCVNELINCKLRARRESFP